jgi:polynucleotide 5'-kinase involved in rRNA processing
MKVRNRISFIGRKKFRSIQEKESGIYTLSKNKDQALVLLKNKSIFGFTGSGTFTVLHGSVRIMGYEINSLFDKNDYDFNIAKDNDIYSSENIGERAYDSNIDKLCLKMAKEIQNKTINLNNFYDNEDKISVIYFKDLKADFEVFEKNLDSNLIDFTKYEKSVSKLNNNSFSISGKKNSGKTTFLLYLINRLLSNIYAKQRKPFLFLLDCDSQPLLSMPNCISLIKINKPLFTNFYNENVKAFEIVQSLYIGDINHINDIDLYIDTFTNVLKLYNSLGNGVLIINTNGNINGLGGLVNTSILEVSKPEVNFYIKNKKQGRVDKGGEYENYITKDIEIHELEIILRKYKQKHLDEIKSLGEKKRVTAFNIDSQCVTVENEFHLKDLQNTAKKNKKKSLYTLINIFGNEINRDLSFFDIIYNHRLYNLDIEKYLFTVPFDNVVFALEGKVILNIRL